MTTSASTTPPPAPPAAPWSDVGAVVIGRNEGARLRACLESVFSQIATVVYVDSGSTDDSVDFARGMGAHVVELDLSRPFTAARARNAGLSRLFEVAPHCTFVHLLDGDCVLDSAWVAKARRTLLDRPEYLAVCGRRRERFPAHSIYNRLTDMLDWDLAPGEVKCFGGDALVRVDALKLVGGFNPDLIAGEEPELCVRLRGTGRRILRLADEMTLHDAAITRFGQWWRRAVRSGHAYAEGAYLHGRPPERHFVKQTRSFVVWAGVLPLVVLVAALLTHGWGLLLLAAYPLQWLRFAARARAGQRSLSDATLCATFLLLSKFAAFRGALWFWWTLLTQRRARLIEYKTAAPTSSQPSDDCRLVQSK